MGRHKALKVKDTQCAFRTYGDLAKAAKRLDINISRVSHENLERVVARAKRALERRKLRGSV